MKTFAIVNQKGGVAKTTTTFNLATALAAQGHNVLMVDLDPQASLTISTGISPESYGNENICRLFHNLFHHFFHYFYLWLFCCCRSCRCFLRNQCL